MILLSEVFRIREASDYENKKVTRVLDESCSDFSEEDFVDLAMACLDQAGVRLSDQSQIEKIVKKNRQSKGM